MRIRCAPVLVLMALLGSGLFAGPGVAATSPMVPQERSTTQHQDGDPLLPDEMNPDNDGDGVVDNNDSAPDDPNTGTSPEPDSSDPVVDSDDDGLPNVFDPDDDSDGVVDDEDGTVAPANVPTAPETSLPATQEEAPSLSVEVAPAPVSPDPESERPLVLALPSTGSEPVPDRQPFVALLIGTALLFITSGGALRRSGR